MSFSSVLSGIAIASEPSDAQLRADLQRLAAMRIYFGHQSVGGNILDGVKQLSIKTDIPVQIAESPTAKDVERGTLGHVRVGKNGIPEGKLASFEQAIGSAPTNLDVALIKFCYVDFQTDMDVKALFSSYVHTVERIKQRNPRLTIIHTTAPLTVVQAGPKAFFKRMLGRAPYGILENMRREEYNSMLRSKYEGSEPLFDLARIESTNPDGTGAFADWNSVRIPQLSNAYTDDGSHLNQVGRIHAARSFVKLLATHR
jgi:hypothetical protein